MGSRAVVLVCRTWRRRGPGSARPVTSSARCGRAPGGPSSTSALTAQLVDRIRAAAEAAGLFDELGTPWLLLDAEMLPWSAKAGQLLRDQYAAVGAAARAALPAAVGGARAGGRGRARRRRPAERTRARAANAAAFTAAYRRYCWPTDGLTGCGSRRSSCWPRRAPRTTSEPHAWHLEVADRLVAADPEFVAPTRRVFADTTDPDSVAPATSWWSDLTGGRRRGHGGQAGREPDPRAQGTRAAGPEGPRPGVPADHLRPRLHRAGESRAAAARGLGHKRSLALREYALGLEALDRAARGEPLWRVHECVFAVLALESEPVDPRL